MANPRSAAHALRQLAKGKQWSQAVQARKKHTHHFVVSGVLRDHLVWTMLGGCAYGVELLFMQVFRKRVSCSALCHAARDQETASHHDI